MTDEYKDLIVEGEKVGDYNDTTIGFDATLTPHRLGLTVP